MRRFAVLCLALAAACTHVSVTPSGSVPVGPPRAADCRIEFFRTKAPERAYDEVATVHFRGSAASAEESQDELRAKACELGADAVIVVRDFLPPTQHTPALMTGTAIRFRAAAAGPAK